MSKYPPLHLLNLSPTCRVTAYDSMLHTLQAGHGKVRVRGLGVASASEGELNALVCCASDDSKARNEMFAGPQALKNLEWLTLQPVGHVHKHPCYLQGGLLVAYCKLNKLSIQTIYIYISIYTYIYYQTISIYILSNSQWCVASGVLVKAQIASKFPTGSNSLLLLLGASCPKKCLLNTALYGFVWK